jgi:hypothetical protein
MPDGSSEPGSQLNQLKQWTRARKNLVKYDRNRDEAIQNLNPCKHMVKRLGLSWLPLGLPAGIRRDHNPLSLYTCADGTS